MNEKLFRTLLGISILGLIIGTGGLINFFIHGKSTLALGSYIPWGLWVSLYTFFLGLTAGAFLITILTYVFRIKIFSGIGPLSAFTVVVTILAEVIIITLDLGHPLRLYRLLITPGFKSMIFWMVVFTMAMLIIYILETYFLLREEIIQWSQDPGIKNRNIYGLLALGCTAYSEEDRQQDHRRVRLLSLLSIPVGLFFYGSNGAVFAVLLNRPIWNSTLTPLLFIISALVSGGALILLLTFMFKRDDNVIHILGLSIRFLLAVMLILEFLHFFISYQWDVVYIVTALDLILYGPYWWNFWFVHLLIGSLVPLYLMIRYPWDSRKLAWACFLIVFTFIAFRLNFVIPDQAVYKLEGLDTSFYHERLRTHYVPNLTEWLVSVWVICLGLLAFLLGARWLPVIQAGRGEEEHV
jgi:molybdopterin-containing oxidoreductase family membrane subunit